MSTTLKLKRGTYNQVMLANLEQAEPAFAIDTKELYVSDGVNKHYIGSVMYGTYSQIPSNASKGKLYFATDQEVLYIRTESEWLNVSPSNEVNTKLDIALNHITDTGESHTFIDQDVTKTSTPTFKQVIITDSPLLDNQAVTKKYVDDIVKGLDWQESVISTSVSDPSTITPEEGDRYLILSGAGEWTTKTNYIAVYKNSVWEYILPDKGTVVADDETGKFFLYTDTSWVDFGSATNHNVLSGIQGGNVTEKYHLTFSQYTEATQYASSSLNGILKYTDYLKIPTTNEKNALYGTYGQPSETNKYVTDSDPRMTNSRIPTLHASTHQHGGNDEISTTIPTPFAIPKANSNGDLNDWITLIDCGVL